MLLDTVLPCSMQHRQLHTRCLLQEALRQGQGQARTC